MVDWVGAVRAKAAVATEEGEKAMVTQAAKVD